MSNRTAGTRSFAEIFVTESAAIEEQIILPAKVAGSGHMVAYQSMISLADSKTELTQNDVKNWQRLIGGEQHQWGDFRMPDGYLGQYRKWPITLGGIKRIGAEPAKIQGEMDALWRLVNEVFVDPLLAHFYQANEIFIDPLLAHFYQAAIVHHRYERIHPFGDGNGRSGRLLALYILRRWGVAPVLFTNVDKAVAYYPCFPDKFEDKMIAYFKSHQEKGWE